MFHTQIATLRRSFTRLQSRLPKAPTMVGLIEQFTTMDVNTLLAISCRLWVATPEQRQVGYELLDRALTQRASGGKAQPANLAKALELGDWNRLFQGKPSKAFQQLLDRAFPCQHRGTPASPSAPPCVGICRTSWHRWPDAHLLTLAIEALCDPDRREDIAEQVVDPSTKGKPHGTKRP